MGLLDWLTEGIGSNSGGMPPMNPMGDAGGPGGAYPTPAPAPSGSMPTPQMTGSDAPPLPDPMKSDIAGGMQGAGPQPYPQGSDPMTAGGTQFPPGMDPMAAGGTPPNGPGLPYPPGSDPMTAGGITPPSVPLPAARPTGANAGPVAPSGAGMPPGPPTSLLPPNAAPPLVPASFRQNGVGPIGRALGLDANRASELSGSLASGLKSVGDNWNKPGLAAAAGSAGSALEGGNKATDKTTEQQQKYLTQAIAAAQSGNTAALNVARTRLALAQAKAAEEKETKPDKASVMNSQEQLYLRGLGAVNQDPKVKASLAQLRSIQAQFGPDAKEAKAALTAHNDLIDNAKKQVFATLGVNEKDMAKIGKQPGFAADNPVPAAGLTKEKFDALPVGAYFINPKDQRLLIKQPPAGANPAPAAQSATPSAAPPVPVTAPAGSAADRDDDE